MRMAEREFLVCNAQLTSGALIFKKECSHRGTEHCQNRHHRGDQSRRDAVAVGALLAVAEKGQFGLSEFSQLLFDKRRQTPGLRCLQDFQGLVQARWPELDDLLEFSQPCIDGRAQFVEADDLTWVVGKRL